MTADDKFNRPQARPIVISPWLIVAAGMVLYGLTVNHWVSLKSMPLVAQVTGWDWQPYSLEWRPAVMQPLFLVLTAPVRLLPVAWEPLALNVFTALCAVLTLGLLSRSVRLMPHDRTRDQCIRELGPHALLSFRAAFLPVVFAVVLLATQLTFWEHAIAATGEMLNVLVFAFIVNCLLEYRISQNDKWLLTSAFVYGLGASNNWALLGFLPFYLIALLWFRGFRGFFNRRFLLRMFGCGVAGLPLYLLIPLLGSTRGVQQNFFSLLHQELGAQTFGLRLIPGWMVLLAGIPTVLPVIFAAIKWPAFDGEISAAGGFLTRFMISVLHIAFLALVLVTFFDLKYSPSLRMREMPISFLTFYYLGALACGYFIGYMMLVFGPAKLAPWERRNAFRKGLYGSLYGGAWVVAIAAPAALAWQSFPHIHAADSDALRQFADQTADCLPAKKSIVLSDDASRLYLLQGDYERRGLRNDHVLIDTESFPHKEYIQYLAARYPELKSVMTTNLAHLPPVVSSDNLVRFIYLVTRNYPVYYLHPSFGYYFEALYLRPAGLVYELKPYTTNLAQPPLVTESEVKTNEAYWAGLAESALKSLPARANLDSDVAAVCIDYAVALDFWGTELQKANYLKQAHEQFAEACRLNTNNFIASINEEYNERLQKGNHQPIENAVDTLTKGIYLYGLTSILRRDGPVDEPALELQLGMIMARFGNLRQATALFQRRLQVLPNDPAAELALAKTYVDARQPDKALALVRTLRDSKKIDPWELARCEALACMAKGDYAAAEKVLRDAIRADPKDENRVATLADYFHVRGVEFLRQGKEAEAARFLTNALTNIDLQLQLVASSTRDAVPMFSIPETLLKKADIQITLHAYPAAVSTLTQVLQIEPKNPTALLKRAESEIQTKQFKEAREDFDAMRKLLPKQPSVAEFGLAQVAEAEGNKADQIDHLKRGLKSAPKESSDYQQATKRLNALEHQ